MCTGRGSTKCAVCFLCSFSYGVTIQAQRNNLPPRMIPKSAHEHESCAARERGDHLGHCTLSVQIPTSPQAQPKTLVIQSPITTPHAGGYVSSKHRSSHLIILRQYRHNNQHISPITAAIYILEIKLPRSIESQTRQLFVV